MCRRVRLWMLRVGLGPRADVQVELVLGWRLLRCFSNDLSCGVCRVLLAASVAAATVAAAVAGDLLRPPDVNERRGSSRRLPGRRLEQWRPFGHILCWRLKRPVPVVGLLLRVGGHHRVAIGRVPPEVRLPTLSAAVCAPAKPASAVAIAS